MKKQAFSVIFSKNFPWRFPRGAIYATICAEVRRMRKILEDIYCGRFSAVNRPIRRGSEYDRAISEVTRCEEALRGKLNPDEVKL